MEHVIQIAIGVDDEAIRKHVRSLLMMIFWQN